MILNFKLIFLYYFFWNPEKFLFFNTFILDFIIFFFISLFFFKPSLNYSNNIYILIFQKFYYNQFYKLLNLEIINFYFNNIKNWLYLYNYTLNLYNYQYKYNIFINFFELEKNLTRLVIFNHKIVGEHRYWYRWIKYIEENYKNIFFPGIYKQVYFNKFIKNKKKYSIWFSKLN